MKKQEVIRNYKLTDANLIVKCNNTHRLLVRDAAEFANYNVLAAENSQFRLDINSFENLATDIELEGIKIDTTTLKDQAAERVKVAIREIMSRAQNKYGVNAGKYKRFGTLGMDTFDDANLLACGRRVARVGTALLTELATKGLTAAMLTSLTALNQTFEDALDNQSDAIANRDEAAEDRVEMGNLLYKKLVEYCETGKTIWTTRDEAKYNDYVIYETIDGNAPVVPPVV